MVALAVNHPATDDRALCRDADLPAIAAVLAVYFSYIVTRRAIVDTSVEHVVYEIVAVALMVAIVARWKLAWMAMPQPSRSFRDAVPFPRRAKAIWVVMVMAITIVASEVARTSGRVVSALGVSSSASSGDVGEDSCGTYNDPACSGDSATIDVIDVFTASVGEELAFRYAVLVIVARIAGVRVAVVGQAVVFGLSHTGFDGGYGADLVVGLIAVGAVSAISVLVSRSIWPAIAAHALHSMGVAAYDHDLDALSWAVSAVYVASVVIGVFAISRAVVTYVFRVR